MREGRKNGWGKSVKSVKQLGDRLSAKEETHSIGNDALLYHTKLLACRELQAPRVQAFADKFPAAYTNAIQIISKEPGFPWPVKTDEQIVCVQRKADLKKLESLNDTVDLRSPEHEPAVGRVLPWCADGSDELNRLAPKLSNLGDKAKLKLFRQKVVLEFILTLIPRCLKTL